MPRPARLVERSHADRPHADALPALPRRQQASGDALRQGPITTSKSNRMFGRSCVNCHSNVHGFNHPSGEFFMRMTGDTHMRRLSFVRSILLAGAAVAPQRALAQSGTSTTGRDVSNRGRRYVAQPVRFDRPGTLHRRPLHQHRRRPGALSALPGRPRRTALLRLPLLVHADRRQLHLQRAREQHRRRDQEYCASYNRAGKLSVAEKLQADPAVLQRRHDDALYGQRRHAADR